MTIIEIDAESEAYAVIRRAVADQNTYCLRIEPRRDGVAIKVNGREWSPTLSTTPKGLTL